jgi:hypothetical protein
MRRIFGPIVPNAVVALAAASVIAAGIGQARAADCLAAPNVASPPGQHWYYRIDRATRRHCWYLHAPLPVAHQAHGASALAYAAIERPAAAVAMPFAAAPLPATAAPMRAAAAPMRAADPPLAASAPVSDDTASLPHVTVLAVKTIAVRPPGARTEAQVRHRVGEAAVQQASTRAYSATPQRKSESPLFFVLVFGLGAATFLMAIVIKCVAPQASWPSRRAWSGAGVAWQQERRNFSGAGPARLKPRSPGSGLLG